MLALFGTAYLDVYDRVEAWWVLCGAVFLAFVVYSTACRRGDLKDGVADTAAVAAAALAPSARGNGDRAPFPCGCCWHVPHRHRVTPIVDRAVGWVLGIGLYFTLRRTVPVFDAALSQHPCSWRDVLVFGGATTAVCWALLVGLELITRAAEAQGLPPSGSTRRQSVDARAEASSRSSVLARVVVGTHTSLRLTLSFVTGKAWEATAFGLGAHATSRDDFLVTAAWWQVAAGVLALLHTMWDLSTQRLHGDSHSPRCACDVCTPEFYKKGSARSSTTTAPWK